MIYINRYDRKLNDAETIDEFETRKEARAMLTEYALVERGNTQVMYKAETKPLEGWN